MTEKNTKNAIPDVELYYWDDAEGIHKPLIDSNAILKVEEQGSNGWEDDGTPTGRIRTIVSEDAWLYGARMGMVKRMYAVNNIASASTAVVLGTQIIIPSGKKGYVKLMAFSSKAGQNVFYIHNLLTNTAIGGTYAGNSTTTDCQVQIDYDGTFVLESGTYELRGNFAGATSYTAEIVWMEK